MCGGLGGSSNAFDGYASINTSQWMHACSGGGASTYPYGDTYEPATCNGVDYSAGEALPVKQASGCQGGANGIYDMSGNVWEWEDSCQAGTGVADQCRLRGGSFWFNGQSDLRCDNPNANDRSSSLDIYGIRCCTP
jgi:formylglycine-generating enzyme required for sulfatase activity